MISKPTEDTIRRVPSMTRLAKSALLLAVLLSACSSIRRPLPQPDLSEDARITSDVEQRLGSEPVLAGRDLRVAVEGRVVRLYGTVEGMGEWNCALRNAELVPGVSSVADFLLIERGPRDVSCIAQRP